jgi:single-strand DNA-binding protein
MYNRVILLGNLTRDVELRYSPSGLAIGKVGIATNRRFKSANGEQRDETMFIDLTFFGRTAEIANQYLKKGSKVLVEGRLVLEQWSAPDGTKRSKHSVTVESMQMIDSKATDNSFGSVPQATQPKSQIDKTEPSSASISNEKPNIPEIDINDDEIPF